MSIWYVIGAPAIAAALVWVWNQQQTAPAWERFATGAVAFGLAVTVGIWMH